MSSDNKTFITDPRIHYFPDIHVLEMMYGHQLTNKYPKPIVNVFCLTEEDVVNAKKVAPSFADVRYIRPTTLDTLMERMQRDQDWFNEHRGLLAEEYPSEYIAVRNKSIIAHGKDKSTLVKEVREKYGPLSFYLVNVDEDPIDLSNFDSYGIRGMKFGWREGVGD